ncbi:lipoyl(octanoyl) transferase LipB [Solimonas sp. SE-A11]|uniref:lipoyl(octanoyl) transferase LipB n=1 Tax=Solimonas sp. SE-A11 TaxID=3054954 RepID=UPI00259D2FBB|nr:lipoyl(octanoyl) transferase LipB [Solimonas sp. SE-A11]MDM4771933.1 lipoyl(octanoyl) transferase LipB [Solimonas sp. SE-A11]
MNPPPPLIVRHLGRRDYAEVFEEQRAFTDGRGPDTADELWFLEHDPVFTQGQAGKPEHLLMPGDIPVVQSDRGGQVTYHGPGQIVVYLLMDLRRLGYSIRPLVTRIEQSLVDTLAAYGIAANADPQAPGVYVDGAKIASLGLRVRQGCSYHGLSLNVDMDLEPFSRINPCGYQGLRMVQVRELGGPADLSVVAAELEKHLRLRLSPP